MNIEKTKTVKVKTKNGGEYSYKYTDLASIHDYLEQKGIEYYQFIDSSEQGDYIMTVVIKDNTESTPRKGCKVISASTTIGGNVAQDYGAILTYCRRYSLLMALGLATEDDDAQKLTRPIKTTKIEKSNFVEQMEAEGKMIDAKQQNNIEIAIDKKIIKLEEMLDYFKVKELSELTFKQAFEIEKIITDRMKKINKEKEEVF